MKLKKTIAATAAIALFMSSALSVSAAESLSGEEINSLKEKGITELILDVDAYRAAYSDLEKAFGDNEDAYIEHYLTVGVYEGRNKGVLFNPLVYAETYEDVMSAYGTDINAIINHYLNFGAAENRTAGTANGYADLATAEKNNTVVARHNVVNNYADNIVNTNEAYTNSATEHNYSNNVSTDDGSGNVENSNTSANSSNNTVTAPSYHHTTSIYDNDEKTLLRVEYYDKDNKLSQFSSVTYTDSSSNSYKEEIYHYDEEKNEIILDRVDTYVNGSLSSSENY